MLDAPAEHFAQQEALWEDPLLAELGEDLAESGGITATSYWFNTAMLDDVARVHLDDGLDDAIVPGARQLVGIHDLLKG